MVWLLVGMLVLVVLGVGGWLLGPTLRALRHPEFEPTAADDASVDRALQSGDSRGAGGMG